MAQKMTLINDEAIFYSGCNDPSDFKKPSESEEYEL
jgi:hypothetical protein